MKESALNEQLTAKPSRSPRRILLKAAVISLPLLALVCIEFILRLFGVGYPTSFFLHRQVNGRDMLVDNPKFGWRFFPPAIARTPEPVAFPARKERGVIRIFVFGESAAMGDPDPAVGLPRMLAAMLEGTYPTQRFEVINVAMTAINSHVIREIARECARLEGDYWIIYAGNNEVVGPFGGGTVFGAQVPPLPLIRFNVWLKSTRIGQLLSGNRGGPAEWEGMEMFLKQQVRADDPRLRQVYAHFRRNLEEIVDTGKRAGAKVIVSTVGVNEHDSPPFASQHARPLTSSEESQWTNHYSTAVAKETRGQWAGAITGFEAAERVTGPNTPHADWHFHVARCREGLGQLERARAEYGWAKELDTLRFRADRGINETVRTVTTQTRVPLVDAASLFAAMGTNKVAGAESFYEHVHLTFSGNYALAHWFMEAMAQQLPGMNTAGTPTMETCARRLGWNPWKQREVFTEVRKRLQQPPFTAQFGWAARDRAWEKRLEELSAVLTPERLREIQRDYRMLLERAPNDWVLHEDYAKLLGETGEAAEAITQWQAVATLLPQDPVPWFHLGNLADAAGKPLEAIPFFEEALRLNPQFVEARNGLGLSLSTIGRHKEAEIQLRRAVTTRPRFVQARVNLGQLLASQGKTSEARAEYTAALKTDTNSAAAHVNLGKLLSTEGDKAGAMGHYAEALRINPNNAIAHYNLGNALVESAPDEAVRHYQAAVLNRPNFPEARYALAQELARQNKLSEALEQFGEVVRQRPEMAEARFNYAVALAKMRQFPEAIREFEATLRLRPDDAKAREFLEKAKTLGRQ